MARGKLAARSTTTLAPGGARLRVRKRPAHGLRSEYELRVREGFVGAVVTRDSVTGEPRHVLVDVVVGFRRKDRDQKQHLRAVGEAPERGAPLAWGSLRELKREWWLEGVDTGRDAVEALGPLSDWLLALDAQHLAPGDYTVTDAPLFVLHELGVPARANPAPSGLLELTGEVVSGPALNRSYLGSLEWIDVATARKKVPGAYLWADAWQLRMAHGPRRGRPPILSFVAGGAGRWEHVPGEQWHVYDESHPRTIAFVRDARRPTPTELRALGLRHHARLEQMLARWDELTASARANPTPPPTAQLRIERNHAARLIVNGAWYDLALFINRFVSDQPYYVQFRAREAGEEFFAAAYVRPAGWEWSQDLARRWYGDERGRVQPGPPPSMPELLERFGWAIDYLQQQFASGLAPGEYTVRAEDLPR